MEEPSLNSRDEGFDFSNLVRENVLKFVLDNWSSDEESSETTINLGRTGNPLGSPLHSGLNHYSSNSYQGICDVISKIKGVPIKNILAGSERENLYDLLLGAFCEPLSDSIVSISSATNCLEKLSVLRNIKIKSISLGEDLRIDFDLLADAIQDKTKLIFISSPHEITGMSVSFEELELILNNFHGIVVVDESYINYSRQKSFLAELLEYPNLLIVQSFSKAWGLEAIGLGFMFGSETIIQLLNKIKNPFQLNQLTQSFISDAMKQLEWVNNSIKSTVEERNRLKDFLLSVSIVENVYPSDANFLLVIFKNGTLVKNVLAENNIVVSDFSQLVGYANCLRISIGTPEQNNSLIAALQGIV